MYHGLFCTGAGNASRLAAGSCGGGGALTAPMLDCVWLQCNTAALPTIWSRTNDGTHGSSPAYRCQREQPPRDRPVRPHSHANVSNPFSGPRRLGIHDLKSWPGAIDLKDSRLA
jgi:hypothetical protein